MTAVWVEVSACIVSEFDSVVDDDTALAALVVKAVDMVDGLDMATIPGRNKVVGRRGKNSPIETRVLKIYPLSGYYGD